MKILHFSDAHVDAVQTGKWDANTGLPIRAMDFLNSLDQIINSAIEEDVDIVLFGGDAYKDRNPHPAYQAEFAKRILRLEANQITTYLLVGNHDMGARSKAHALTEFITFNTEYIHIVDKIHLFGKPIDDRPYNIIALPWIHKNNLSMDEVMEQLQDVVECADPNTPNIFLGHCSVSGARYSTGQTVTLGKDLMLPKDFFIQNDFDYVALGHIHKPQNLNGEQDPPIIYPGSIERVNWGESQEDKYFIIFEMEDRKITSLDWIPLNIRPFLDGKVDLTDKERIYEEIEEQLEEFPSEEEHHKDPMVRIKISYPEQWAGLINNQKIEEMFPDALSVQVVHEPERSSRTRLSLDQGIEEYSNDELLELYFEEKGVPEEELENYIELGREVMQMESE